MQYSSVSNIGKVRNKNQDYYGSVKIKGNEFFIVADGMGGYKGGEIASKLAVNFFIDYIKENQEEESLVNLQEDAINYANDKINEIRKSSDEYYDMGTTVVCVCIDNKNSLYHFSHIGDSRAYLYSKGVLKQVTRDHSLVNDLLDSGSINEEEAKNYEHKSIITKVIGCLEDIDVKSLSFEMDEEDIILMTTDGLSNELSKDEIFAIMTQNNSAEEISKNLVDLAIKKGGHDNITVTTILI